MLVVSPLVGKSVSSGEEGVDLGKALVQACSGCALPGTALQAEKAAARAETSELSSVPKQTTDGE